MTAFICAACGTQYPPSETPPAACPVCTDERQYVPAAGQSWTTLEKLRSSHSNKFRRLATDLTTIETTPAFGIGQRAILARTPAGNVLWDCIALVPPSKCPPSLISVNTWRRFWSHSHSTRSKARFPAEGR